MSLRTLRFLLRKEFQQVLRDRAMLRMLLILPAVQLLILSNAATFQIRQARMYVVDQDHSTVSRGVVERLRASGRFRVVDGSPSMRLAGEALLARRASVILHLPARMERDLVRTGRAPVQLVFNAEDGAAAGILSAYAGRILGRYSAELATDGRRRRARIDVRTRGWYNPELRYTYFMVPGILVVLVTMVASTLAAMNIVREKEIGTLEQLNVTPLGRGTFVAGKLIPFWIIAMVDLAIGLLLAHFVFGVPVRGSLLLVFGGAAVYLLAALGIGLLISTIVDTQQQAMFLSFALNMVYLLMSGLFTPLRSMPEWAQWLAEISPVKHFLVIMRSVLVKGAGLSDVAMPLLVLAVYGALLFALAMRQYRKTTA
jgi:ABC-2 type transport system permease protein